VLLLYYVVLASEENLMSSGSGDEGVGCVFVFLGGIVSKPTLARIGYGRFVIEEVARRRCLSFGNNDAVHLMSSTPSHVTLVITTSRAR
jgi:hypothetical protein